MRVLASGDPYVKSYVADALDTVAMELYNINNNKKLVVTSAGRTLKDQAGLFYDNCLLNDGYRCNPDTCDITNGGYKEIINSYDIRMDEKIIQKLIEKGDANKCPHTSLVAVDVWCDDGGNNYRHDPNCQNDLTKLMVENGFCRLPSEAWHFEWNHEKVSDSCTTNPNIIYDDNGDDPTNDGCTLWDYEAHTCVGR